MINTAELKHYQKDEKKGIKRGDWVRVTQLEPGDHEVLTQGTPYLVESVVNTVLLTIQVKHGGTIVLYDVYTHQVKRLNTDTSADIDIVDIGDWVTVTKVRARDEGIISLGDKFQIKGFSLRGIYVTTDFNGTYYLDDYQVRKVNNILERE